MAFGTKYKIISRSIGGTLWHVNIELDSYSGSVTEFKGNGTPINIKYVDNNESKISSIRASSAVFSFVSDTFELQDIIDDNDTMYRVSLYQIETDLSETLQWRGFISTDDCSEPYISGPRVFTLTALDGLAILKDEPYKWQDGTSGKDAYGKRLLLNVIADCLQYTYTELDINIQCDIYEEVIAEFLELPPFNYNKVHTKLFLYADGGPKNMYEVIECIMLSMECTIFQQFGRWHIKRFPDEFYDEPTNNTTYYLWPSLTESQGSQSWTAARFTDFNPIQAGHVLSFIKPNKYSKITHNYIIPETPENEKMARGSLISGTPGPSATVTYEIDFWSYESGAVLSPTIAATGTAYRNEVYDTEGNLKEQYIVLPDQSTNDERMRPEDGVWVDIGDKLTLNADTRSDVDEGGAGTGVAIRIVLFGDSGQKYTYDQTTSTWVATISSAIGSSAYTRTFGGGDDTTAWFPFTVETAPFPEGGLMEMWFCDWTTSAGESWYRNINIDFQLFLNSVTANFKGEYSQSDNNLTSRNSSELIIKLGDSPKRLIASALWKASDDTTLTNGWGRKDEAQDNRLIDLNSQDLQNTAYRVCKSLDGEYKGIAFDSGKLIGVGNLFSISGVIWIATNLEIDIINETFSATLQELKTATDVLPSLDTEFKYIFDERS